MKYALTSFALIVTLLGGFIFGAYYMYKKNNPPVEVVGEVAEEEVLDNSDYYDSDGNWQFKYNPAETGYGGNGEGIASGGKAAENIDYRITGTNFVYEDDGRYSGFHAVVTVENISNINLYLGSESKFDIEDRNLDVVDSYDYVRSVPDVIAPGERGYFYVPYGQIKTREESVTIEEGELSGDVPNADEANSVEDIQGTEDNNSISIDELEDALEGAETDAKIKVEAPRLMAAADAADSSSTVENTADKTEDNKSDAKKSGDASAEKEKTDEAGADNADAGDDSSSDDAGSSESSSGGTETASDDAVSENGVSENGAEAEEGTTSENASGSGSGASAAEEADEQAPVYPGLSIYRSHEYFIMPYLDIERCANDPRKDFNITGITYGSNAAGYFTLSGDVTNDSEKNVDYVPVTVVALDRRRNAIAVGRDSLTDFYSGAKRSFGVSYVLTREQRSNIAQCVIFAREIVTK